jgi:hypothetical protein
MRFFSLIPGNVGKGARELNAVVDAAEKVNYRVFVGLLFVLESILMVKMNALWLQKNLIKT